jgi:molybdopterin converting factor small subunit
MRDLTGGRETVEVRGRTVGEVIAATDAAYPGVGARLCPEGALDAAIAVYVDGRIAGLRLAAPVHAQSEVQFLPAIAGG